jgi:hypothetical protein
MGKPRDTTNYAGLKVNRLTVLEQFPSVDKAGIKFLVRCDCGTEKMVRKSSIMGKRAETVSCGCYLRENGNGRRGSYDPRGYLLARARERAKHKGWEFSITKEDIIIPEKCPLLGITIIPRAKDRLHSPSLDRIDSSRGYTPDNIQVVSSRANTLKNDATVTELETLLTNWKQLLQ